MRTVLPLLLSTALASIACSPVTTEPTREPNDLPRVDPAPEVTELDVAPANGLVEECTQSSCTDTMAISFSGDNLEAGTYEVTLAVGYETAVCAIEHPTPAKLKGASICTGPLDVTVLDADTGFPSLLLRSVPSDLRVSVRLGEVTLANAELEPTVRDIRPNGLHCGPVCKSGSLLVSMLDVVPARPVEGPLEEAELTASK